MKSYESYHYETKELIGFIRKLQSGEETGIYRYFVILYRKDDLNTGFDFTIFSDSEPQIYGILNSIRIQKMTEEELELSNEQGKQNAFYEDYPGYEYKIDAKNTIVHDEVRIDAPDQLEFCRYIDETAIYDTASGNCTVGFENSLVPKADKDSMDPKSRETYENLVKKYTDKDPYSFYASMYLNYTDNDKELRDTMTEAKWIYDSMENTRKELNNKAEAMMSYERDDIIGFVMKTKKDPHAYECYFYRTDDLYHCYTIYLQTKDDETAYGMINSIQIQKNENNEQEEGRISRPKNESKDKKETVKARDSYQLPQYTGYDSSIESRQTVSFKNLKLRIPDNMSTQQVEKRDEIYQAADDESFLTVYIDLDSAALYVKIARDEEIKKFIKKYTNQDPNCIYTVDYMMYAYDSEQVSKESMAVQNWYMRFNTKRIKPDCYNEIMQFETDELIGFVISKEPVPKSTKTCYDFEVYQKKDLNCQYLISICADSKEEAFGIINSVQITD